MRGAVGSDFSRGTRDLRTELGYALVERAVPDDCVIDRKLVSVALRKSGLDPRQSEDRVTAAPQMFEASPVEPGTREKPDARRSSCYKNILILLSHIS